MDGTGRYYAKSNKSVRERQISYVFTHMWNLRNRRPWGKGRGKNSYKQRGREANHKRLLNTENKLRVHGGGRGEERETGDGHLGSVYNLAIVESTAVNIGVHVPLCISTPVFFG